MRTLAAVERAARLVGLRVYPSRQREVLFACPRCRDRGLGSLAVVEVVAGVPVVSCRGCEAWGDDPRAILHFLGHDPVEGDEYEVLLRVFDLLWAMHRHGLTP
jgi:hypothetical protein